MNAVSLLLEQKVRPSPPLPPLGWLVHLWGVVGLRGAWLGALVSERGCFAGTLGTPRGFSLDSGKRTLCPGDWLKGGTGIPLISDRGSLYSMMCIIANCTSEFCFLRKLRWFGLKMVQAHKHVHIDAND